MKIHVDYEAEVPDSLIKTPFCNGYEGNCEGRCHSATYPEYCKRFSQELKQYGYRYKKCEACKKACAEAIINNKKTK